MSPAGMWSVCPRIHWCYKGCTGFCRATPSMDSMDGRSQKLLTRKKIDIFEFSQQGSDDPKVSLCYMGLSMLEEGTLKTQNTSNRIQGRKIMTKSDQTLYFFDTGVEFTAPTFGSIMNAWAKFPENLFRFLACSKTTFQCWKVWKGAHRARMQRFLPILFATMVFVLKANLNQANLFMLSAKQNCQIFLGSWLGTPFPRVKCQAAICIYCI